MTAEAVPAVLAETANERLKRTFSSWFWGSMIVATLVHGATFAFWPELTAEDISYEAEEIEAIELPPEIEIPPPPQAISRPATPVMATADIDEDITIAPTTFEENPVEDLPPPPEERLRVAALARRRHGVLHVLLDRGKRPEVVLEDLGRLGHRDVETLGEAVGLHAVGEAVRHHLRFRTLVE